LQAAQSEVEAKVGFPMVPTYFTDEQHDYGKVLVMRNRNVIELGVEVVDDVSLGLALSHVSDPATASCAVTFTDTDEVRIYHPGTDYEISPSSLTIAGGVLSIEIPRVRTVKTALFDNPEDGHDYTDTSNFESTIDVKRIHTNTTTPVTLVGYECGSCEELTEATTLVNGLLRNGPLGIVDLSACVSLTECICNIRWARVNYRAGWTSVTPHAEDAIIRLAHSRMPSEPCGCDYLRGMWERDRHTPQILTAERENCPFGMSDGAWQAWCYVASMNAISAGVL
jgi:hypothetical protein